MGSSSDLSVDYFDSRASNDSEAMFSSTSASSNLSSSGTSASTMATSDVFTSEASFRVPRSPGGLDFSRIAAAIEKARRTVAVAAPFILNDFSGEAEALMATFLDKAPVFRDAFADAGTDAPSEVEATCGSVVPEQFSIDEKSARSWAVEPTTLRL